MALMNILKYPDPKLRLTTKPVEEIDRGIRRFIDDLVETMYEANGAGLAATQVGSLARVAVIDISREEDAPELHVIINPEIVEREGEIAFEEGCLSFPNIYEEIKRSARVVVEALDREGQPQRIEAEGIFAVALQHEIDHLFGKLIIDYMNPLKRRLVKRKMLKMESTASRHEPPMADPVV